MCTIVPKNHVPEPNWYKLEFLHPILLDHILSTSTAVDALILFSAFWLRSSVVSVNAVRQLQHKLRKLCQFFTSRRWSWLENLLRFGVPILRLSLEECKILKFSECSQDRSFSLKTCQIMMTPWLGPYKTSLKVLYTLAGALPYKACPWYMLSKI